MAPELNATVTALLASTSTVTLFPRAYGTTQRLVFNASTAVLYLKFGEGASTSSYTVQVGAGALFEFPGAAFDGVVTGVWAAANGTAMCTEVA